MAGGDGVGFGTLLGPEKSDAHESLSSSLSLERSFSCEGLGVGVVGGVFLGSLGQGRGIGGVLDEVVLILFFGGLGLTVG